MRDESIKRANRRRACFPFSNRSEVQTCREQEELCLCFGFIREEQGLYCGHASTEPQVTHPALILGYNGSSQNPIIIPGRRGMCQPDLNLAALQNGKSSLHSAVGFKMQIKSSPFPFYSVTVPQNSCPEDSKILDIAHILFGDLGFCYN